MVSLVVNYYILQVGYQRLECDVSKDDPWVDILINIERDVKSKGYDMINVSSIRV